MYTIYNTFLEFYYNNKCFLFFVFLKLIFGYDNKIISI